MGLVRYVVFIAIDIKTRRVEIAGISHSPPALRVPAVAATPRTAARRVRRPCRMRPDEVDAASAPHGAGRSRLTASWLRSHRPARTRPRGVRNHSRGTFPSSAAVRSFSTAAIERRPVRSRPRRAHVSASGTRRIQPESRPQAHVGPSVVTDIEHPGDPRIAVRPLPGSRTSACRPDAPGRPRDRRVGRQCGRRR